MLDFNIPTLCVMPNEVNGNVNGLVNLKSVAHDS